MRKRTGSPEQGNTLVLLPPGLLGEISIPCITRTQNLGVSDCIGITQGCPTFLLLKKQFYFLVATLCVMKSHNRTLIG